MRFESLENRLLLAFDPAGVEQEVLFNLNRMRVNPQGELSVLFSSISPLVATDPGTEAALEYFNDPTTAEIETDWPKLQPTAPLAWNVSLYDAATAHSELMIQDDEQSHQLPGEQPFYTRDADAGYTNEIAGGENIFGYGTSGFNIHSAFAVDYGNADTDYGHRTNMMDSSFQEVGIAVDTDTRTGVSLGPLVTTEDFGGQADIGNAFLVGVVYNDANHDGRYEAGEGLSGVTITITGSGGDFSATTMTAGGYQIQIPAGTYQVTASGGQLAGSHTVTVTVGSSNVEADFVVGMATGYVNFVPDTPALGEEIVGNGQPGFWSSGSSTWTTGTGLGGSSLISATANGSEQSQAAWWFSMPAGVYEIDMTWTAGSNLTANLGLDLYDGVGNWIGQIPVNEQIAPSDFSEDGVEWKRLGSIDITSDTFHISTWNSASDGAIDVNAIRLVAAPTVDNADVAGSSKYFPTAQSGTFATTGSWAANANGAFGGSLTSSSAAGSGTSMATWTMPVTPGSYEVDVLWTQSGTTLTANATYNVYDGGTKVGSVSVDQQTSPSQILYEGLDWQSLGSFTITGTKLTVTLANTAADGQVSADAIRILPAYQPAPIVDNSGPGFWSNSAWTTQNTGLYGNSLLSNTANGSKNSQAAWWFPVQPGEYQVFVTWAPGSNLTSTAPFDVYDALTYLSEPTVNEQKSPVGVTDQGVVWQSLGTFTITSDVLHVSTWNSQTNGAMCVDAVRIVPVDV
jgi:hypothetical protein